MEPAVLGVAFRRLDEGLDRFDQPARVLVGLALVVVRFGAVGIHFHDAAERLDRFVVPFLLGVNQTQIEMGIGVPGTQFGDDQEGRFRRVQLFQGDGGQPQVEVVGGFASVVLDLPAEVHHVFEQKGLVLGGQLPGPFILTDGGYVREVGTGVRNQRRVKQKGCEKDIAHAVPVSRSRI